MNEGELDKVTCLLSKKSLNLRAPFCIAIFTSKKIDNFLNYTHYRKLIPLPYVVCTLMPQIIPLLTLTLVCMWYEKSTPRGLDTCKWEHTTMTIHVK